VFVVESILAGGEDWSDGFGEVVGISWKIAQKF
jgi:hypothetical protein